MNLKESYRYANFLDRLLITADTYLRNKGFVTTTEQNHLRSKANPDAQDEKIEVQKPYDVDFTPNDIIDFVVKVINEKENLFSAIADAKTTTEINIDNAIAMNKKKQSFVNTLNILSDLKTNEKVISGSDYKFNQEGNQVKYFYNITEVTKIDYNRLDVKKLIKKYLKETDEISEKLDTIEINTKVIFEPIFDVNSSFEDLVVEYVERKDE